MYTKEHLDLIKEIDFGEVDGYGDPNLDKYFLDDNFWEKIIKKNVFYVVGKKGTGKSSIYRAIESLAIDKGAIISNKDFGEFPYEKLLQLSDDSFSAPNQYQSIWQNMILQIFAQMIASIDINQNNIHKEEISEYINICVGKTVSDLHKKIVTNTIKTSNGLVFKGLNFGKEQEITAKYNKDTLELSQINSRLLELIINYLKSSEPNVNYIIQFDRLDDNYNQYQNLDKYFQSIISLFKTTYYINQKFRQNGIVNAKVILYVRTDILKEMAKRDSESARWEDFKYEINWRVNNIKNWQQSKLFEMIDKRIKTSSPCLKNLNFIDLFQYSYLSNCEYLFPKMLVDSLFRPRNLIMLCKVLQKYIIDYEDLNDASYKSAIKVYSNWLVNSEIANEISPILKDDYKSVKELLELCGGQSFTTDMFKEKYNFVRKPIKMDAEALLCFLYDSGVIENCWIDRETGKYLHKSVFRNEGEFNRNMLINIIPCVWKGLTG